VTTSEGDLTPTEWLVLEVLAARYRLGHSSWHFPNTLKSTLTRLEERNLITFKSATIEQYQHVWLTEDGRSEALWEGYTQPTGT